jgi:hypothetical protein
MRIHDVAMGLSAPPGLIEPSFVIDRCCNAQDSLADGHTTATAQQGKLAAVGLLSEAAAFPEPWLFSSAFTI